MDDIGNLKIPPDLPPEKMAAAAPDSFPACKIPCLLSREQLRKLCDKEELSFNDYAGPTWTELAVDMRKLGMKMDVIFPEMPNIDCITVLDTPSPSSASSVSLTATSASSTPAGNNNAKLPKTAMLKKRRVLDEEFEVEEILDYKRRAGQDYYFIKWQGWPPSYNTWEPKEHLQCSKLIREYHLNLKRKKLSRKNKKRKDQHQISVFMPLVAKPLFPPLTEDTLAKFKQKQSLLLWQEDLNRKCTDPGRIVVENHVDLEGPPTNFIYINDYKAGEGVVIPEDPLVGCSCTDCFESMDACCPTQTGAKFAYTKTGRIRVRPGKPIYECNKRCSCDAKCSNRVIQKGRLHNMAIFRTANGCGWGVKTLQKIKKNTFVMTYVGEVITNEEAEERGKVYDENGRTYLFDLDYNDEDAPYTVDAAVHGNISHFVNHSCNPNMTVYNVFINCLDPRLPHIALFSNKDIEAGEELTFDYLMYKGDSSDDDTPSSPMTPFVNRSPSKDQAATGKKEKERVPCRCGAENCRKYLY
ncbi:SUV39H1 [Branchiostoma lanceolatum]|uniref:Histone-lysine N-methyltransferase n=1 Tax=Branchiostoma lanceolatum TaxID=7740 RepID=A0A8J9ZYH4_BRALA|nr:SUV39H1 [Branchiostoma lanceolatum]